MELFFAGIVSVYLLIWLIRDTDKIKHGEKQNEQIGNPF